MAVLARLLHKAAFAAKYQPLPGLRVAWLSRIEADLDAVRIVIREIRSGPSLRDRNLGRCVMANLREEIASAMKNALKAKDQAALATMRLISAALKDRDIAARGNGNQDGIGDDEILSMMQTMIKQRTDSAKMYRDGNRPELAEAEEAEITIITGFLPAQLGEAEIEAAIADAVAATGASSIKDMGQVMAQLKSTHAGQMDFSAASQKVKAALLGEG